MAEINDLERTISRLSGFNPEEEIKRLRTLDAELSNNSNWSRKESAASTPSSAPTLTNPDQEVTGDEDDPNIVWWDGPDDPENPMVRTLILFFSNHELTGEKNWPQWRKNIAVAIVSSITFIT